MQTLGPAGWPTDGSQGRARFKWMFDTVGGDGVIQGGSVRNAEFMIMLEDLTLNAGDPTLTRDLLGELTFLDSVAEDRFQTRWDSTNPPAYTTNTPSTAPSPSPDWQRLMGSGIPGVGGPQGATGSEIGYRIEDNFVDMYVDLNLIGGTPELLPVLWLTDQQDTNIDQAPCCDRPETGEFIVIDLTGSITIDKVTSETTTDQFDFTGDLGEFTLGEGGAASFSNLDPGEYSIAETVPAGWNLGSIICGNGDTTVALPEVTISLSPNEDVTCTFVNVAQPVEGGTVTIVKNATPGVNQDFDFAGDLGNFTLNGDPSVGARTATFNVGPGVFEVVESGLAGWDLFDLSCNDPDGGTTVNFANATAAIDVDSGEAITCVFENHQRGSITVQKLTDPGSTESFAFTGDLGDFSVAGGNAVTFEDLVPNSVLNPGTYTITEIVPAGWFLAEIECVDGDGDSTKDVLAATAEVSLDPGEDVLCTFTDVIPGTLTVTKQADVDDGTVFDFESNITTFALASGESIVFDELFPSPNPFFVTELVPDGWSLTTIDCVDQTGNTTIDLSGATATIQIDPGDDVACTFGNTAPIPPVLPVPALDQRMLVFLALILAIAGMLFVRIRHG